MKKELLPLIQVIVHFSLVLSLTLIKFLENNIKIYKFK
jgi:hypothetical protein